jgi:hypothetical protein
MYLYTYTYINMQIYRSAVDRAWEDIKKNKKMTKKNIQVYRSAVDRAWADMKESPEAIPLTLKDTPFLTRVCACV